jgi:hypothetical protein
MYYVELPTGHEIWIEYYQFIILNPNLKEETQWLVTSSIINDFDMLVLGALPSELRN